MRSNKRKKQALVDKYGKRCYYCNASPKRLTVDHKKPRSKGGSNSMWNLVLACLLCNRKKGNHYGK